MDVDASFERALTEIPIAGSPAGVRWQRAIDGLPDQFRYGRLRAEGLFPLLRTEDLEVFLSFAQSARSPARWPATDETCGLTWLPEETVAAEPERVFEGFPPLLALTDGASAALANQRAFSANARRAMAAGALLLAPDQTWIEDEVQIATGVVLEANVALGGATRLETGVRVSMGCHLRDAVVGADTLIRPYCVIEDAVIGARAQIGPFAHLRTGTDLADEVRVGNFVETKKARLGKGSKASHLTYLGDAEIGANANIGAGTITCNYDGYGKHLTRIGDGVFIGSNSQLVAPVSRADGAYVAAGSTVTHDVPEDALVIARSRQSVKPGLAKILRERAQKQNEMKRQSS